MLQQKEINDNKYVAMHLALIKKSAVTIMQIMPKRDFIRSNTINVIALNTKNAFWLFLS